MATKVYGRSDDLIEFGGDIYDEIGGSEKPETLRFSDGTELSVKYGKDDRPDLGVWEVKLLKAGSLFERIDVCDDDEADPYSDVAHFRDGLEWCEIPTHMVTVRIKQPLRVGKGGNANCIA